MTSHYGLPSPSQMASRRVPRILWIGQSNAQTQCSDYSTLTKWRGPWGNPLIRAYRRSIYLGSDLTEGWRSMTARRAGVTNGATGLPGADLVCCRKLVQLHGLSPELIEFTQGATNLYQNWQKADSTCYTRTTTAWANAISTHPAPPTTPLPVIVWIQGESDAQFDTQANAYGASLTSFFNDLRTDIPALATAPLILAKLHPNCVLGGGAGGTRNGTIRSAQVAYAAGDARVSLVEVSDLVLETADALHYDQASQITLGVRIAAAIATALG